MSLRGLPVICVSLILVALAAASPAQAALSADTLQLTPERITSCARSLTLRDVSIAVSNRGVDTDSYEFSIQAPAGWEATIQKDLTLASGETKNLDLFVVNMPLPWTVPAGTYDLVITARSLRFPTESISTALKVTILNCYSVDVSPVLPQPATFCMENKQTTADFVVTNTGRGTQSFDIISSSPWAIPSRNSITLVAGGAQTITLTIQPPAPGRHELSLTARSPISGTADTERLTLQANTCYSTQVAIQPTEAQACLTQSAAYSLLLSNTGTATDSFQIVAPEWVEVAQATVSLAPGETRSILLTATPGNEGTSRFNITVIPSSTPQSIRTVSASLEAQDCRGVLVSSPTTSASVCSGTAAEFDILVKNTGAVTSTYTLSASAGTLSSSTVMVPAGETGSVKLNVTGELGTKNITVSATDGKASGQTTLQLAGRDCYGVAVAVSPNDTTACNTLLKSFIVFVKNKGELKDTYRVTFAQTTQEIALGPGESKTFQHAVTITGVPNETQNLQAVASSPRAVGKASATVQVLDKSACYTATLSVPEPVSLSVYKAAAYPFKIRNTGQLRDSYFLRITGGPDWVFTSPKTITLDAFGEAIGYVYAQPDTTVEKGVYSFDLEAVSASAKTQGRMTVSITDGAAPTPTTNATGTTPQNDSGQNVTIVVGEGGKVQLNVTGGKSPAGLALPNLTSAGAKVWVLAGIVVVVIIILVARFALL